MKKVAYIVLMAGVIWGISSCKKPDSVYEEFLVPNGMTYPGKALNVKAYSGKGQVRISWQIGDPNVEKTRIFWNNFTKSVEVASNSEMDIISHIIEPLDENTYSFSLRTYDADGNFSIPVEVIGTVYGDMYERSLVNRSIRNANYDEDEGLLIIEWIGSNIDEIGVNLTYTNIGGNQRELTVENSDEVTIISDLKAGEPVFYQSMFKPDPASIDVFYAPQTKVPYFGNITDQVLKNTKKPFNRGALVHGDYYEILDWQVNPAGAANGNVRLSNGNATFSTWNGEGFPASSIVNGKMFQTVVLEAGSYRLVAVHEGAHAPVYGNMFLVAAKGSDLPNRNNLIAMALAFDTFPPSATVFTRSIEFGINEEETVSLGFVASFSGNAMCWITKVELWKQF